MIQSRLQRTRPPPCVVFVALLIYCPLVLTGCGVGDFGPSDEGYGPSPGTANPGEFVSVSAVSGGEEAAPIDLPLPSGQGAAAEASREAFVDGSGIVHLTQASAFDRVLITGAFPGELFVFGHLELTLSAPTSAVDLRVALAPDVDSADLTFFVVSGGVMGEGAALVGVPRDG